jgi:hypothetical protein
METINKLQRRMKKLDELTFEYQKYLENYDGPLSPVYTDIDWSGRIGNIVGLREFLRGEIRSLEDDKLLFRRRV